MKILATADDSGCLKEITCVRGTDTSKQAAPQPESIVNHCEGTRLTQIQKFIVYKDKYVIVSRAGGNVQFYDLKSWELVADKGGLSETLKDKFVALFLNESDGLVYSCTEAGKISIIDPENIEANCESIKVPGPISAFTCDHQRAGIFAMGGKENDLKVFKLKSQIVKKAKKYDIEYVFKGKNVSNSKIDLRQPIWITNIAFLPSEKDVYTLITVTRYGEVRRYVSNVSRKPVLNFKLSEKPLITLAYTGKDEIVCSDTHTTTAKFEVASGRLLGKFPGAVGSIQTINLFKERLLATGGLDRYVRVFDMESREVVAKVYVGAQISDIVLLEDDPEAEVPATEKSKKRKADDANAGEAHEGLEENESSDESSDEEEMWAKLETKKEEKSAKATMAKKIADKLAEIRKKRRV